MFDRSMFRPLLSVAVWLVSVGTAYWLVRGNTGVIDAPAHVLAEEFRLAPIETGRLVEVMVSAGQRVRQGQLLARMDTSILEREIAVAEARLKQVGAEGDASMAAIEADGYQTERSFQTDAAGLATQLETARASFSMQNAELAHMSDEIARQRQLVREGLTRADRLEDLELRRKTLADAAAQWPERIATLASRHQEAVTRLEQWRSGHRVSLAPASRETRLRPLRDRVNEQLEALRVLRARFSHARLTAPADGEVVSVLARTGDVVRPDTPFVILNGSGPRYLVAYVGEQEGKRLRPGADAVLTRRTPDAAQFSTRIIRVADAVVQVPQRFWIVPTLAQWGREVTLALPEAAQLDPGEALTARLAAGDGR